ncbi:1627_t:CDS:2 [Paraglomus brasilianum]|uniref:1627_t:CDS:1 n=1 Tax=Paraglomus brasilianum TaxID=144538 RepID=A0A9N9AVD0_9GLOM|nr:1627_t:CDS:2 [Paraglomus brasilianum]
MSILMRSNISGNSKLNSRSIFKKQVAVSVSGTKPLMEMYEHLK